MKRVYFAGSIRGGREDLALYAALIARLRERSEVLTEFIGESTLEDIEAATMTDFDIYERDMALLHQADAVVAECSTPSLGVGYELGSAHALGLPVYILYRPRESRRLSAMVSGNRGFTLLPYGSREEALAAVNRILAAKTSAYWEEHFNFRKVSPRREKRVGDGALNLIAINTVIPFLYAYGLHKADDVLCDRATRFLESLKAENNHVTRLWDGAGLPVSTAADSQALLQLQKEYCDRKDCLRCRFGYEYLRRR